MKALQLDTTGRPRIVDVPGPEAKDGETLVRVTHCAICRTDAKMSEKGHRDLSLPRILGHEICGEEVLGGTRCVVWPGHACGSCEPCVRGEENLCPRMRILGFHRDGGLAESVAVPKSSLIPVPSEIPSHLACLAEPLACTLNALELTRLSSGERLLIYGGGPVGLMMSLAARVKGAHVTLAEPDAPKLARSRAFRDRLNVEGCVEFNESRFHAAVNAAPSARTLEDGLPRLRPGGTFCLFSGLTDALTVPSFLLNEIHYRQLKIVGAYGCTRKQMGEALSLIQKHGDSLELLVERVIGLDHSLEALKNVLSGKSMKIVVRL